MLRSGPRILAGAYLLAAGLLMETAGAATGGYAGSYLIRTSATFQRLGDFRVLDDPTYRGALAALGESSSCRLVGGDPSHATATWRALGVRIDLRTYGALPRGQTGCSAPALIHVSTIRVTGSRWYTSRGLRVGAPARRVEQLYPHPIRTRGLPGWYGRGYWLVTRRGACIGLCPTRFVTIAVLVAEVEQNRVSSLVFVVGAQGD